MPAWEINSPVFISSVCLMADAEQEMALWGGRGGLGWWWVGGSYISSLQLFFLLCASVYMYLLCVVIPYGLIFMMHNIMHVDVPKPNGVFTDEDFKA